MTRKSRWLWGGAAVIIVMLSASAALMWKPAIAPIAAPAKASFDTQTKLAGARVVALGDCIVCHTAKGGEPFAV
jgi:mono/diheme cytochrome c family protein